MAVAIVLLVVILAVVGGVVYFVKARADAAAADRAGIGANEILQSPPTSFPTDRPAPPAALPTAADQTTEGAAPATGSAEEATFDEVAAPSPAVAADPEASADPEPADESDDDVAAARFRVPGARATGLAPPVTAAAPPRPSYPLEPVVATPDHAEPARDADAPAGEVETAAPEPAPVEASSVEDTSVEATADVDEPAASDVTVDDNQPVIDLDALEPAAAGDDVAWRDVVLQPEPDAVDHVLQALINRARFKQVGVEEVATELVERADLRGEEVSDVLAELVGRADEPVLDAARPSELVLFNDAVPSRPGQLTDFAKLNPADKKRIIIRVLCLLVARSEDQQLPPRATADSGGTSWPLARAVWPVALSDDEPEGVLPSRLAKSG